MRKIKKIKKNEVKITRYVKPLVEKLTNTTIRQLHQTESNLSTRRETVRHLYRQLRDTFIRVREAEEEQRRLKKKVLTERPAIIKKVNKTLSDLSNLLFIEKVSVEAGDIVLTFREQEKTPKMLVRINMDSRTTIAKLPSEDKALLGGKEIYINPFMERVQSSRTWSRVCYGSDDFVPKLDKMFIERNIVGVVLLLNSLFNSTLDSAGYTSWSDVRVGLKFLKIVKVLKKYLGQSIRINDGGVVTLDASIFYVDEGRIFPSSINSWEDIKLVKGLTHRKLPLKIINQIKQINEN